MNIESWCTVELNSKQDWLRANRKHNTNAFASSVFKGDSNQHQASRLDFKSSPEKHRERRHFPDKGKKILKFSWLVHLTLIILGYKRLQAPGLTPCSRAGQYNRFLPISQTCQSYTEIFYFHIVASNTNRTIRYFAWLLFLQSTDF